IGSRRDRGREGVGLRTDCYRVARRSGSSTSDGVCAAGKASAEAANSARDRGPKRVAYDARNFCRESIGCWSSCGSRGGSIEERAGAIDGSRTTSQVDGSDKVEQAVSLVYADQDFI